MFINEVKMKNLEEVVVDWAREHYLDVDKDKGIYQCSTKEGLPIKFEVHPSRPWPADSITIVVGSRKSTSKHFDGMDLSHFSLRMDYYFGNPPLSDDPEIQLNEHVSYDEEGYPRRDSRPFVDTLPLSTLREAVEVLEQWRAFLMETETALGIQLCFPGYNDKENIICLTAIDDIKHDAQSDYILGTATKGVENIDKVVWGYALREEVPLVRFSTPQREFISMYWIKEMKRWVAIASETVMESSIENWTSYSGPYKIEDNFALKLLEAYQVDPKWVMGRDVSGISPAELGKIAYFGERVGKFVQLAEEGPSYSFGRPHETGLGDLEISLEIEPELRGEADLIISLLERDPQQHLDQNYFSAFVKVMGRLVKEDYPWQVRLGMEIAEVEAGIPADVHWDQEVAGKYKVSFDELSERVEKLALLLEIDKKS